MADLFCTIFQNSILLCGFVGIGSMVDMLFIFLAITGLFVLSIVVAVGFACRRYFRPQDSEPLSILGDAHRR